ncbi:MAG: hypothetical protein JXA93_02025 [Anaerolineae bacterium]|nr:hypothetical protein [Anaerolineae bacterium]
MNVQFSNLSRILILLLLVLVACACGSGSTEATVQAAKEQKAQLEATLSLVCDGQGAAEAATYQQVTGVHPIVSLEGVPGAWRIDETYARREGWLTEVLQDVELVVCVRQEPRLIETCPYTLQNGASVSVERYQYETTAALHAARTGETLAEMTWTGSEPQRCSAETSFQEGETVKKYYGVGVGGREVGDWLAPYVAVP